MNLTPQELKRTVEHIADMCNCRVVVWYSGGRWFEIDGTKENMELFKVRFQHMLVSSP